MSKIGKMKHIKLLHFKFNEMVRFEFLLSPCLNGLIVHADKPSVATWDPPRRGFLRTGKEEGGRKRDEQANIHHVTWKEPFW